MTEQALRVLVVGGGMYVTGRGSPGSRGTVGPALMEAVRAGRVGALAVVTSRLETGREVAAMLAVLAADMGIAADIAVFADFRIAAETFRPDAAIVSVPDHLHAEVTTDLAGRGIHCLVAKPMAPTLAEAQRMTAAARRAGVVGQVEFHKRLDESSIALRDAVRDGRLGTPLYATVEYSQRKSMPRDIFRGWIGHTNIFQYLGVHYVDLVQWATGFAPTRVSAWGQKGYLAGLGMDTWDAMQAVVEWRRPDGGTFVSTYATNWIDPDGTSAMSDQKINLVGTAGRFQADQKHRGIEVVTDGSGPTDLNPYFTFRWHDDTRRALRFDGYGVRSVLQFVDDVRAVRAGTESVAGLEAIRPSFAQCLVSVAVVEAAVRSADAGIAVDIPPFLRPGA